MLPLPVKSKEEQRWQWKALRQAGTVCPSGTGRLGWVFGAPRSPFADKPVNDVQGSCGVVAPGENFQRDAGTSGRWILGQDSTVISFNRRRSLLRKASSPTNERPLQHILDVEPDRSVARGLSNHDLVTAIGLLEVLTFRSRQK